MAKKEVAKKDAEKKSSKSSKASILAKLAKVLDGDDEDEDPQAKADELTAQRQIKTEAARQASEQHYWITPIRMQGDNEDTVFVCAAGVNYLMAKGVRVPVPVSVINALKLAHVDGYVPVVDEVTGQKKQQRVRYDRYPFQNDGPASLAEVNKWKVDQQRKAKERDRAAGVEEQEEVVGRPAIEFGEAAPVIEG